MSVADALREALEESGHDWHVESDGDTAAFANNRHPDDPHLQMDAELWRGIEVRDHGSDGWNVTLSKVDPETGVAGELESERASNRADAVDAAVDLADRVEAESKAA